MLGNKQISFKRKDSYQYKVGFCKCMWIDKRKPRCHYQQLLFTYLVRRLVFKVHLSVLHIYTVVYTDIDPYISLRSTCTMLANVTPKTVCEWDFVKAKKHIIKKNEMSTTEADKQPNQRQKSNLSNKKKKLMGFDL